MTAYVSPTRSRCNASSRIPRATTVRRSDLLSMPSAQRFGRDNGGALPSNLLAIPNSQSNDAYLRACKALDLDGHPARFPAKLPAFFIEMLTDPGDLVVDFFGGSNTTGRVAEDLGRRWLSFELNRDYAALSAVRFMEDFSPAVARRTVDKIKKGRCVAL